MSATDKTIPHRLRRPCGIVVRVVFGLQRYSLRWYVVERRLPVVVFAGILEQIHELLEIEVQELPLRALGLESVSPSIFPVPSIAFSVRIGNIESV